MKSAIIISTYNEADNIETLLKKIVDLDIDGLEIIVVDDSSPDGTGEIVKEFSSHHPEVHLLSRKERGRGSAGIAGFKKALERGADCVIEMDADFSHAPEAIPLFLEKIRDFDVVIGSRFVPGSLQTGRSWSRRIITLLANLYIRIMLGMNDIKDKTSGYRCFRTTVVKDIDLDNLKSNGPSIIQEMLLKSYLKGYKHAEIPIIYEDRRLGKSSFNWKIAKESLAVVWRLKKTKKLSIPEDAGVTKSS